MKKSQGKLITYLEKAEMNALIKAPDRQTIQGRRDYALLLFLYNTGARANRGLSKLNLTQNYKYLKLG